MKLVTSAPAAPSTTPRTKTMTTDLWPAFTTHSDVDVIIAALSMTRLVEWCSTPCVHTADAAEPGTGGRPSEAESASVVVGRVLSAEWRSDLRLHVVIDADLSGCRPLVAEARLLGRASQAGAASVILESMSGAEPGHATELPADIGAGDLVIVPCLGITLLHDVKVSLRSE